MAVPPLSLMTVLMTVSVACASLLLMVQVVDWPRARVICEAVTVTPLVQVQRLAV